jgi:hypothetical protein
MLTPRTIELLDRSTQPPTPVGAEVVRDFPEAALAVVESLWKPERAKLTPPMEHVLWDWTLKSGFPFRFVAVVWRGRVEGLAALYPGPRQSELTPTTTAAYVAFLETAPWNLRAYPGGPRLRGAGTALLTEAILLSHEMGQQGRVLLSALSQAEDFYRWSGMTELGPLHSSSLVYFEYTETQAANFLAAQGVTI